MREKKRTKIFEQEDAEAMEKGWNQKLKAEILLRFDSKKGCTGYVRSKSFHQVPYTDAQSLSHFRQRIDGGRFLSAFNSADENGRKFAFFSELLLA